MIGVVMEEGRNGVIGMEEGRIIDQEDQVCYILYCNRLVFIRVIRFIVVRSCSCKKNAQVFTFRKGISIGIMSFVIIISCQYWNHVMVDHCCEERVVKLEFE